MIVIPACGEGKRFKEAGYTEPKHLIPLGGKPMIEWVVENVLALMPDGGPIYTVTQDWVGKTRGAIDTILSAASRIHIPQDQPLVVANCDQLLKFPEDLQLKGDGVVFTFRSNSSAHSYAECFEDYITHIVEKPKIPPSDRAVSGVYWFHSAGDFLEACRHVTGRIEGEQYISAALSQMMAWGYDLYAVDAPTTILGTPEDFQRFQVALEMASDAA